MILIIIALWMGFLWLLIKVGLFKGWAMWMKLSPVAVWAIAQAILFLPMSWSAPSGPVSVFTLSTQIAPSVAGTVSEVVAKSGQQKNKGDVLFKLDPTLYEAQVEQIRAELQLAELRLKQKSELVSSGAGLQADVNRMHTDVKRLEAQLKTAQWKLDHTVVRAPGKGYAPSISLQPGTRVTPDMSVMTYFNNTKQVAGVQIRQSNARHIKLNQEAEVVFDLYPGKTFAAKVTGLAQPADTSGSPFRIEVQLEDRPAYLPPGSAGMAAIYTDNFPVANVLRKITLRMTTWMNFVPGV